MEFLTRFFLVGILSLLLAAPVGCSFKKDANTKISNVTLVGDVSTPKSLLSIEDIISTQDEKLAIGMLAERKAEVAALAGGADANALDMAIKYSKMSILSYLLVEGHSPFVLSQDSYKKLEPGLHVSRIVRSARQNAYRDIVGAYSAFPSDKAPSISDRKLLQSKVAAYQLDAVGCEELGDLLIQMIYFEERPKWINSNYQGFSSSDSKRLFYEVFSGEVCSSKRHLIAGEKISKWIGYEFVNQAQIGFRSRDFLLFLSELIKGQKADIVFPAGAWSIENDIKHSSHVRINPISILMLKKTCIVSDQEFDEWLQLTKSVTNMELKYSYPPFYPNNSIDSNGECKLGNSCPLAEVRQDSLWAMYRFEFPASNLKKQVFDAIYGLHSGERPQAFSEDEERARFRAELCRISQEHQE